MTGLPDNFALHTLDDTAGLAKLVAATLTPTSCLALSGELGSGKTSFARALLRELGIMGDIPSPTFTLVQTYDTARFAVHHWDLYRLKSADELDELGWDDALQNGVTIVEWPERAKGRMPKHYITLHFTLIGDVRSCAISHAE